MQNHLSSKSLKNTISYMPKVSVCIPVRNGFEFIEKAVLSVLQQTYQNFELIVVDNFSTDNTVDLIEKFTSRTDKIKLYKNEKNIGLIENFNACLYKATGKYIKFLCADDVLMPNCLELMVSSLELNDCASLVTVGRLLINEEDKALVLKSYVKEETLIPGHAVINRCLFGANYIGEPSATMFRREMLSEGFDAKFPHLVDLEMWFRLLEKGDLISIPLPLCGIRRHKSQMTQHNIQSPILVEDNIRLFDIYNSKSYVEHNLITQFERKARMAYRVWISRKYIQTKRRNQILKTHSSYILYYIFMPVLSLMLTFFRKLYYKLPSTFISK